MIFQFLKGNWLPPRKKPERLLCSRLRLIDGKVLTRFGNHGGRDLDKALFLAPHTVAIDSHGDIYVGEVSWSWTRKTLDRGPRTVQKLAQNNIRKKLLSV